MSITKHIIIILLQFVFITATMLVAINVHVVLCIPLICLFLWVMDKLEPKQKTMATRRT